ncbi:MAG: hypothetical protein HYT75_02905 [Deltaproteobacteria bacterium]|nr:hypothetical protein [Deltaproteobacteria bacterium]MBI2341162.1 hypothetical protein [Deltaproteobacteria bacterium]
MTYIPVLDDVKLAYVRHEINDKAGKYNDEGCLARSFDVYTCADLALELVDLEVKRNELLIKMGDRESAETTVMPSGSSTGRVCYSSDNFPSPCYSPDDTCFILDRDKRPGELCFDYSSVKKLSYDGVRAVADSLHSIRRFFA